MTEVTADVRPTWDLQSCLCSALQRLLCCLISASWHYAACNDFVLPWKCRLRFNTATQREASCTPAQRNRCLSCCVMATDQAQQKLISLFQKRCERAPVSTYLAHLPRSNRAADASLQQLCCVSCPLHNSKECLCCTRSCAFPYSLLWLSLRTNLLRGCWGCAGLKSRLALEATLW